MDQLKLHLVVCCRRQPAPSSFRKSCVDQTSSQQGYSVSLKWILHFSKLLQTESCLELTRVSAP